MARLKIKVGEPVIFDGETLPAMAEKITEAVRNYAVPILALNILPDHLHMVVGAGDEKALNELIRKVKGYSARAFVNSLGYEPGMPVWARKFNRKLLQDEDALAHAVDYVTRNHYKHAERWGEWLKSTHEVKIEPLVERTVAACAPSYMSPHDEPLEGS
jgi:REP element-mobilizing transposase RayT